MDNALFDLSFSVPMERCAMNLLINDTHASREILYFTRHPSMNVPEETFFLAAQCTPGFSVLYRRIVYCPRKVRIKFWMIVLSYLWWHLPFGNRDVSITWSHLLLPDDIYMGKCEWKLHAFRKISGDRLSEISTRLMIKLSRATVIFLQFIIENNFAF